MQRSQRPERREPIERPVLVQQAAEEGPLPPFMSAQDAATLMCCSPDHVNRSVREGAIPGYKWGSMYRVLRAFVEDVYAEICAGNGVVIEEYAQTWRTRAEAVA